MKKIALSVIFIVLTTFAALTLYIDRTLQQPMYKQGNWLVTKGSSVYSVLRYLQPETSQLIIRLQLALWRFYERSTAIKAGEYVLKPDMTITDSITMLIKGDVVLRDATLVEGWTVAQARQYLSSVEGLVNDLQGTQWDAFLLSLNLDSSTGGEGWFAPDTYHFSLGNKQTDIFRQAHSQLKSWLEEAWQQRPNDLPLANPYELLILASIIEKETALTSERGNIASVFLNRLRRGMRLQTDPTVIYGLGEAFDGDLRRRDLTSDTPYNTYRINGLPPTPIALPSRDALMAVVNAPATDYLYFVAKGDGSSYFSTSLAEHNSAVKRYQLSRRDDYRSTPNQRNGNER